MVIHSKLQFPKQERLAQVVVGLGFQTGYPVPRGAQGRKHQHQQIGHSFVQRLFQLAGMAEMARPPTPLAKLLKQQGS